MGAPIGKRFQFSEFNSVQIYSGTTFESIPDSRYVLHYKVTRWLIPCTGKRRESRDTYFFSYFVFIRRESRDTARTPFVRST